jgi:hypothetical protein
MAPSSNDDKRSPKATVRAARNRRNKRLTVLGELTDDLRLALRNEIEGKMQLKAAARHMGVSVHTLKSFLTSVYVYCPREKFLKAVIGWCFVSESTRTAAKKILARTTGEYGAEFLGPSSQARV